jgi:hypothetical protein
MPRRTGLDTLFDNENTPTGKDLMAMAEQSSVPAHFEQDAEDYNQEREGHPGEFGNKGELTSRYGDGAMTDEDFENAISKGITNAENYIDMELSPDRELAARYYRAEPFGNEIEGRSAVVMSEVRDTVLAVMPALLRIFCGTREPVEFLNNPGTPIEQAKQQTGYISQIVHVDNDGFTIHHSAFKDALIRKSGVYTWWHEEIETVEHTMKTGLDEAAFAMEQLEAKESSDESQNLEYDVKILEERPDTVKGGADPLEGAGPEGILPEEMQAMQPQQFIRDIMVIRRSIKKRHRVACVPPEEFIVTPVASADLDEFPLVGRRQMKTIGELVAMGHDENLIREAIGGKGSSRPATLATNAEAVDRQGAVVTERLFDTNFAEADPASENTKYCEVYVLIDADGDGIRERHKVCTVGDNNKVIYDRIVSGMVPYAIICPDPEPHTPFGYSLADQSMDMQEIKSEMVRGVLDSLAQSIVGRTVIVEGKVNIDDVLSNDRDQVIRAKEQGAVQALNQPFTGMNVIPVLSYLDTVQSRRTGINVASTGGLSADVLQSTPVKAAEQMVDASQERAEMIARIFAETGIKRMYRGLAQQVVKHQDVKRVIRLMGRHVEVDPREFNADLDLYVNVGLGRGTADKRIAALNAVLEKQQQVYTTYGPDNPFVTLVHISNAVADWVAEHEVADISRYMNVLTPDMEKAYLAQQAQKQPKPTPEELLYKAQSERTAADSENKRRSDVIKMFLEMAKLTAKKRRN